MCGIAGFVGQGPWDHETLTAMTRRLTHRGPDDEGYHYEPGIALGMRRLAIVDRSGGRQPFHSEDGNVVVVLNGEIYNHTHWREILLRHGHRLQSGSDGEILAHLYEEMGPDFLTQIQGMFAIALWDRRRQRLLLARDRLGKKPLYIRRTPYGLGFASEVKSFLAQRDFRPRLRLGALGVHLTFRYVPAPLTLFEEVEKVAPGEMLLLEGGTLSRRPYWELRMEEESGRSEESFAEELRYLLDRSVGKRLMGEVPIGLFLSGGLDSSALLASLAAQGATLRTFALGYRREEEGRDYEWEEFAEAEAVARHFGVSHRRVEVDPASILPSLAAVAWYMDEPMADPTALPLYQLARSAREDVTVALSGEGSDELFAGYDIYFEPEAVAAVQRLPLFLRRYLLMPLWNLLPAGTPGQHLLRRSVEPVSRRYFGVGRTFTEEGKRALLRPEVAAEAMAAAPEDMVADIYRPVADAHPVNQMLYFDTRVWLPEDTLLKADKMSMAHSLELRVPMLDHHLVEWAGRLPVDMKLRAGTVKYILKQAMAERLPAEVLERRKVGFPVPLSRQLGGDYRAVARGMLLSPRALDRGLFDPSVLERLLSGAVDSRTGRQIYTLLMLEVWQRLFLDGEVVEDVQQDLQVASQQPALV